MPKILINGLDHYYEQTGEGPPLVFIHGAFADCRIWDPQWEYFSAKYHVLRYDLRGHGRTGRSDLDRYSIDTYADDLASLVSALGIESPVICGLSWGGGIAQSFAIKYPDLLKGLVLAGASAAMSITLGEKLLRYVLFPKPAMMLMIRILSVDQFIRFSLWLSGITLGKDWLNKDESTFHYLRQSMSQISKNEYLKIWGAIYGFDLAPLEKISCPTLVVTGEHDTKMVLRHASEIIQRVPQVEARVLPAAYHAMTLEEPERFNKLLGHFLQRSK
jgi:pimeloyl-ACP methyl ester carboxylesterase